MRIVERTPDLLRLEEPQPPLLRRSFIFAGFFFTIPILAGAVLIRNRHSVVFALGNLAVIWGLVLGVYALARRTFRSKTTCTFDRRRGELTVERAGRPPEVHRLETITDLEVESVAAGRGRSYRTLLHLGRDAAVALSDAHLPDVEAFRASEAAIRELLGFPLAAEAAPEEAPPPPLSPAPERRDAPPPAVSTRARVPVRCRYCLALGSDNAPLALRALTPEGTVEGISIDRCRRCARIHAWHEGIGPVLGLFLGGAAAVAAYFVLVFEEAKGPVRNIAFALPFMLLMFLLGAGGVLLARAVLDPRRHSTRPQGDWSQLPEIAALREQGWRIEEPRSPGID